MICPLLDNLYPRTDVVGIFWLALVPVELLLKARLRFGIPPEGTRGNFEFSAAKGADSDCRSVLSHLTTQRRRWIMRTLSPGRNAKTRQSASLAVQRLRLSGVVASKLGADCFYVRKQSIARKLEAGS
jgi:hypothetical protein